MINEFRPMNHLTSLQNLICTIGNLPTSYVLSLSYEEQIWWLCDFLEKKVFPAIEENTNITEETQQAFIELQNYVRDYFNNLDVQEEINNKLDEMSIDGTLSQIINDEIFNNLNLKIDNAILTEQNNFKNSKYVAPLFLDNEYRQSINYVTNFLEKCKFAGFNELQMLIHINNDGTIKQDISKFENYNQIANSLNLPIKSLKIHGNYNSINYQNLILEMISYFPECETVFIFNEQSGSIIEHGLTYPSVIKNNYPNIKKVGFTLAYNKAFYNNSITYENWQSIENIYDIIGVNVYPSLSNFSTPNIKNYKDLLESFNSPAFILPWGKEIWITESGVLPYWQALELPENYDLTKLTDTSICSEPQRLFFQCLNDSDIAKKANKILPWYLESGMNSQNEILFENLKNIITK